MLGSPKLSLPWPPRAGLALAVATVVLFSLPLPVSGQYFGRNKVQYEEFDFRIFRAPHLDVYYYPEEEEAVLDAVRMGERWYERFARAFQHEFEAPKPLILYADHPDFQQTNTLRGFIGEGTGGVTESLKNRVIMPLQGAYADTDHVLGHELVHAFQYNIAQSRGGGGLQGLARLPLWLVEGMAEYLSVGREDPLTAMWLRDAILRDDFPTITQMSRESRFFPYRFGQALWAHIGGEYGDDAVIQIFRRSLRVGWEGALDQVLGIGSDSLSARWRSSVAEAYLPLMEGKTPAGEAGALILSPETGAGGLNVAPSLSPDGRYVAFLSEKDLFSVDLFMADARTGEVIRKLSSAAADPHADALRFIDSSGSWSPDGSRFIFVVFADGDNHMVVVETANGNVDRRIRVETIGAISNPAWSPDGSTIAFSGSRGGVTDIYLYDLETEVLEQLTDDRYGDFQPAWSPDGSVLAFTSDRGPETNFDDLTYSRPQIVLMDMATRDVRHLPIFGNVKHMNPQYSPDGSTLYFISDRDGFSDIYRLALETGEVFRVTELATGVSGITAMAPAMTVAANTGSLIFSVFNASEFHVYSLDVGSLGPDSRVVALTEVPAGRMLPPAEPEAFNRVANYLSDPFTGLAAPGTFDPAAADAYDSSLHLDYVGQPTLGVAGDRFGTYIGGGAAAFFSDMLGDRNLGVSVQAQGTFKDIGGQLFYQNMKHRWNWGVGGGRLPFLQIRSGISRDPDNPRLLQLIQLKQRIFIDSFNGLVSYPFSTTRRIEIGGGFTRYSFDIEQETFILDPFGNTISREQVSLGDLEPDPLNLVRASVALVGDNSFTGFVSPVQGGRYRLEVEQNFGSTNYTQVVVDVRRYFRVSNSFTLAMRGLHFGRYGGNLDGTIIQELFLGWETFVRGYAPESFENDECQVVSSLTETSTLGSCPSIDRLFGQRLAVANVEVRVPFFGTDRLGLVDMPYLPTELVLFTDAGLAWNADSNVRLVFERNSVDRVPVVSSGVSARMNILGFLVLEAYYAYPFQRPDKGWHWGFQISPGW